MKDNGLKLRRQKKQLLKCYYIMIAGHTIHFQGQPDGGTRSPIPETS
jgi:hypothetical protein